MSNENYDYEYLAIIAKSIQEHAIPRPYDYDILHVAVTGVFVSAVFAFIAFLLNKRQINIAQEQIRLATEQQKISEKQADIAHKQAEIMEQQNKIALFEKRHFYFKNLRALRLNCLKLKEKCLALYKLVKIESLKNKNTDCSKLNFSVIAVISFSIIKFEHDDFIKNGNISYLNLAIMDIIEEIHPIKYLFHLNANEKK